MKYQLVTILALVGQVLLQVAPAPAANKVKLAVYYESLCPDSHNFVNRHLVPTYKALQSHLELELVPFGNVNVTYSNSLPVFHCQHGAEECWGNRVEACAIHAATSEKQALDYVGCMFHPTNWRNTHASAEKCALETALSWETLKTCNEGAEGEKLIEANWHKTTGLVPKKTWIPWITINGAHTAQSQNGAEFHLEQYLCQNYLKDVVECKIHL